MLRPKTRVRFVDFRGDRTDDGQCVISVSLEHGGVCVKGTARCGTPDESLRCSALAMLDALQELSGAKGVFELLGIKAVKAFDTKVIIVAISAKQGDGVQRLVGSCLAGDNAEYGAAVSVLNATNRFMGSTFYG